MKTMRLVAIGLSFIFTFLVVARAGFRVWTDKDGKAVEAEYVRMSGDKVVLRLQDKSEISVGLDTLSEADQRYAMLQAPPKIEIKVADSVDRETLGYTGRRRGGTEIKNETVDAVITLKKTSSGAYEGKLKLEVLLMGRTEQLERYIVIEKAESKFQFTDENKGIYTYECKPRDLKNTSGRRETGSEYNGYLVVVRDRQDNIIGIKASRIDFEKNAEKLLKASRGDVFDKQFRQISSN